MRDHWPVCTQYIVGPLIVVSIRRFLACPQCYQQRRGLLLFPQPGHLTSCVWISSLLPTGEEILGVVQRRDGVKMWHWDRNGPLGLILEWKMILSYLYNIGGRYLILDPHNQGHENGWWWCYTIRKATGSYRTNSYLLKLQPWFLSLRLKSCLWAELQPWFLSLRLKSCLWAELQPWCLGLQWNTCPWAENSDILIIFWRFISFLKYWWACPIKAATSHRWLMGL